MRGRIALLAGIVVAALGVGAAPAMGAHHLVRITEVYAGLTAPGGGNEPEFVELQMPAAGENLFNGETSVVLYDAAGLEELTLSDTPPNPIGGSQRFVLFGSDDVIDLLPPAAPDYEWDDGNYLDPASGAACFISDTFGPIDCVSWGTFSAALPSPTGGAAPAMTPLPGPLPQALRRSKARGCSRLLDAPDDTNRPSDWGLLPPDPQDNGDVGPTIPCPQTRILKKPKKRTTKRSARFTFTATQGVDEFKCKLDRRPFKDCTSPFRKRVRRGRHTFKVRAEGDPTPASYSWRVVKRG